MLLSEFSGIKMSFKILVTGGAGFIGSFLVDELVKQGHDLRIFDNLTEQVHQGEMPSHLNKKAEFVKGSITDYDALKGAVKDIDVIYHQAAMVGVGQSMYQIQRYVEANTLGTANLLDILVNTNSSVRKLIVASSMSTYGEGSYHCSECSEVYPKLRAVQQMEKRDWEMRCPKCSKTVKPVATKEEKAQDCTSIYAITKKDQEEMCLTVGRSYGIPTVALRYFNVYGPRQSLSNPYTGVAAIFQSRLKNNNPPVIYEDGLQTRDFVSVHDIVAANMLAMKSSAADYEALNVGTGNQISIKQLAEMLAKLMKKEVKPEITHQFRKGDIRHCFADISKIQNKLGFKPKVRLEEGMKELVSWSSKQKAVDKFEQATEELKNKRLL